MWDGPGPYVVMVAVIVLGWAGIYWLSFHHRGRPIVVIDARTLRRAERLVDQAEQAGDLPRAMAGAISACLWLRGQARSRYRRRRQRWAPELARWEGRADQLWQRIGGGPGDNPAAG